MHQALKTLDKCLWLLYPDVDAYDAARVCLRMWERGYKIKPHNGKIAVQRPGGSVHLTDGQTCNCLARAKAPCWSLQVVQRIGKGPIEEAAEKWPWWIPKLYDARDELPKETK